MRAEQERRVPSQPIVRWNELIVAGAERIRSAEQMLASGHKRDRVFNARNGFLTLFLEYCLRNIMRSASDRPIQ
jgi:hypothetical protein